MSNTLSAVDLLRRGPDTFLAEDLKGWTDLCAEDAGGALPFLFSRISLCLHMMPGVVERIGDPAAAFRAFYYDTALTAGPATFACLRRSPIPRGSCSGPISDGAGLRHQGIRMFGAALEELDVEGLLRPAIYRENAARLLGRLI